MKISYTLTLKEYYIKSLRDFLTVSRVLPFMGYLTVSALFLAIAVPLVFIAFILYTRYILMVPMSSSDAQKATSEELVLLVAALEVPAAFLLVPPLMWPFLRRRQLEIDPEGVVSIHTKRKIRYPWQSITVLEEDAAYITIASRPSWGRTLIFTIPRRAFASNQEAQAFFDQATAYRDQAVSGRPPQAENLWPPAPEPAKSETSEP